MSCVSSGGEETCVLPPPGPHVAGERAARLPQAGPDAAGPSYTVFIHLAEEKKKKKKKKKKKVKVSEPPRPEPVCLRPPALCPPDANGEV